MEFFEAMTTPTFLAWTDGASLDNPGEAGLGFVLLSPDGVRREGYQGLGKATNNVAELTAILRVAEITPEGARLEVHTDSKYAIGVVQDGWKATKNVELIASVRAALARLDAWTLRWVKAHAAEIENIVADKLSVLAARAGAMSAPSIAIVDAATSTLRQEAVVEAAAAAAASMAEDKEGQLVLVLGDEKPRETK